MPLDSTIPNLAQLQEFRRSGRYDPSLKDSKCDVMKSNIVGLKLGGKLIGFGTMASPAEIAKFKQSVSKSAELPSVDLNTVFDDSALLPVWEPDIRPIFSEVVQKSADVETKDTLEGVFPTWLQSN